MLERFFEAKSKSNIIKRHLWGFPPPVAKPGSSKGPCGTTFQLKDDFPTQNTILSAQKAPAGRISGPKYNLIRPKGPCGTTFCYSQNEIYDLGTEILIFHCFVTKMLESFCKPMIFSGICSICCVL